MKPIIIASLSMLLLPPGVFSAPLAECVSHRGYWVTGEPENTVESIRLAYAVGANWVETDFNAMKDGSMLCFHDRQTRDRVIVPPYHVPTLEEVLAVVPKDRGIQAEIKTYSSSYADRFDQAVKAAGLTESNVIVSSFNRAALADFKRRKPAYRTLLLGIMGPKDLDEAIEYGRTNRLFAICPGVKHAMKTGLTRADADRVRAAGFSFRFFGVNGRDQLKYAHEVGVDAFTCNSFEAAFDWAKTLGIQLQPKHAKTLALIAHRGESADAPENTLPAYRTAVERGFGFECDIYLSKDKQLFTFHDSNLTRTTDGANTNRCTDVDWADTVSKVNVGGWGRWKGSKFDPTRPARLSEVLELARDGRWIYVEVKGGDPTWVPYIKDELARSKSANPRNVLFISFNAGVCAELKRQLGDYRVYWLTDCTKKDREGRQIAHPPAEIIAKLREIGADGVDISYDPQIVDTAYVKAIKDAGFSFHVWTIDDPKLARKAFAAGADTLTTNRAKYINETR